jgi:hypothetical protein
MLNSLTMPVGTLIAPPNIAVTTFNGIQSRYSRNALKNATTTNLSVGDTIYTLAIGGAGGPGFQRGSGTDINTDFDLNKYIAQSNNNTGYTVSGAGNGGTGSTYARDALQLDFGQFNLTNYVIPTSITAGCGGGGVGSNKVARGPTYLDGFDQISYGNPGKGAGGIIVFHWSTN